jgi:DNA polymerase-3 subunit gamma/tau
MSLYQQYRPRTLEEMVGNSAVVQGIRNHFAQDKARVSHSHIIYGPSGCGKTTLARAIATSILGADPDISVHEINFASNRGVDTAREIIEQMKVLPLVSGAVVYIIDEAHGMTTDAKRAFLKPLEDCPDHVYFFLCTTNLTQLLKGDEGKAIGTRCTQWKVEPLTGRQLGKLVAEVAEKEQYPLDDELLTAIVDAADGSPRAALVALEKVMPLSDRDAQLKVLEGGVDEDPDTLELCRLLTKNSPWSEVSRSLASLKGTVDPEALRRGILGYCQTCMLKRPSQDIARVMEEFSIPTYDTGFPGIVLAAWRVGSR